MPAQAKKKVAKSKKVARPKAQTKKKVVKPKKVLQSKASAKKKVAKPKKVVRSKAPAKKQPKLECGVCGYRVIVDETCGCVEEHVLVCCNQPMAKK
ncbi:MAG: hypothetical protein ABIK27_01240 [Bacteroidota bacterium]